MRRAVGLGAAALLACAFLAGGMGSLRATSARLQSLMHTSTFGGRSGVGLGNRIALYTGNTYYLWPRLKFSGIRRPFAEYRELLSVVVIYRFEPTRPERITDVTVVAHETWRIASRARASATREYIGSISNIKDLVAGRGEFESATEFYDFWRSSARKWKKSPEAERLLRRALDAISQDPPGPTGPGSGG